MNLKLAIIGAAISIAFTWVFGGFPLVYFPLTEEI